MKYIHTWCDGVARIDVAMRRKLELCERGIIRFEGTTQVRFADIIASTKKSAKVADMGHVYITDELTSRRMSSVSPLGTSAEKALRTILADIGIQCEFNRKDLQGRPDIVISSLNAIIFVHGCFWHRHNGCVRSSTPARNANLWREKFQDTIARDRRNQLALRK